MRAREFTINIPINIRLDGDGNVDLQAKKKKKGLKGWDYPDDEPEENEGPEDTTGPWVPPLQQDLEIGKALAGRKAR
jgi:hypothetical protein